MKQYSQQELDAKINAFLTQKLQKYPEFTKESKIVHLTVEPSKSSQLAELFVWPKVLASH